MKIKLSEEQKIAIQEIVELYYNLEVEIRKKFKQANSEEKDQDLVEIVSSEVIFNSLINYLGNFIFNNSADKEARFQNYHNFLEIFKRWFTEAEKHQQMN